jgi:ABC-type transport system involved in cytochrome c biogenesis permease subunit
MKSLHKWAPWLILAVFAVWIIATLRPPAEKTEFNTNEFGRLPVLLNGRVQPLDSVARNTLLMLRGKQDVELEGRKRMTGTEWLLEVLMRPDLADDRKVFRVDNSEVKTVLHLDQDEKHYSFNEIKPQWEELEKEGKRVQSIDAQLRTPYEKQLLKIHHGFSLYFRLKNSIRPEGSENFLAELNLFRESVPPGLVAVQKSQTGEDYKQQDLMLMVEFFQRYSMLGELAYPLVVPPWNRDEGREEWRKLGASLMESMRPGPHFAVIHPAIEYYGQMTKAYRDGTPAEFNQAVASYKEWLGKNFDKELAKGKKEFFYNQYEPFYKSAVLYVFAFILGCAYWVNWSKWLSVAAFRLILLAMVVHTSGLIFRMVLEGRPPVTNLYSSAIFVGWGAVVLGAILERFYRDGIGSVTAAAVGFSTLVIAHNLSLDGDTMEMLRAVLDTNFWLATHVVVITLGYSAVFIAGFLAIIYVFRGVFTRSLTAETAKALTRMVYGIICFATLFSFVGTILGGIWADQSWGRFWGWDPKENGALLIVIWAAIVLHAKWGGLIRERGLMSLAVFGGIVTSFSWFGTNMLGVGLHSYGFMDQAFKALMLFVISQLLIIGIATLPLKYWRSYALLNQSPEQSKPSSKPAPSEQDKRVPAHR